MANKVENQTDVMVEAKGKLELFFDKWGNKLLWTLVVVAVVVGAYFIWKSYSDSKKEVKAQNASVALTNAVTAEDFVKVANDYEGTEAANTALYRAGAMYLADGDLENAKTYLNKYENLEGAAGELINANVYGLRGDIAVEQDDLQTAADLFKKAAQASDDQMTYVNFMQKLAIVYASMGDDAKSQQCYKDIIAKYPQMEASYGRYVRE